MLEQRIENLRKILMEKNLDGFLVSNFYNILYLTGFKTLTENDREGWGLVTKKNTYLFTDSRYRITNDLLIVKLITPEKGLIKHLQEIVGEEKIQRLGFEGDDLKVNELQKLREHLINVELVSLEKLIIKIRGIKDEEEIKKIKMACQIADQCLEEIVKIIKVGATEKEIAFKIEFWLKEKNYDLSFYPIVAIDKNSAVPHYDTRNGNNEKVKKNSIILIDFGAKFQDYHSDMTRIIFVGKPTNEMINTYKVLLNAQEKTVEQLKIDSNPVSVDQFCRKLITDSRLPTYQHSTGHGVGLQIHEYPKISFTSTDVLLPNQVVTIEPGVYIEDKWGMRIEDTVLIKENKRIEVLTQFSKQPLII
ncbi:aminopeptidase P family protein [Candidatus Roizmanbacteria bacterium]|nr:aminopeptidase P family protein [Candidatus Roizmanbacteria bacterium]